MWEGTKVTFDDKEEDSNGKKKKKKRMKSITVMDHGRTEDDGVKQKKRKMKCATESTEKTKRSKKHKEEEADQQMHNPNQDEHVLLNLCKVARKIVKKVCLLFYNRNNMFYYVNGMASNPLLCFTNTLCGTNYHQAPSSRLKPAALLKILIKRGHEVTHSTVMGAIGIAKNRMLVEGKYICIKS